MSHLFTGVSDKQLEEAYTSSDDSLAMPAVGDLVAVVVTAILSATKFYIQMPVGSTSVLTKQGIWYILVLHIATNNPRILRIEFLLLKTFIIK